MTILKNILLSLAIAPLAISTSFAQSGNDMKSQSAMQAQIIQPMAVQENRVIKQRDTKAVTSGISKQLQHDEIKSKCYYEIKYLVDNNLLIRRSYDECVNGSQLLEQTKRE